MQVLYNFAFLVEKVVLSESVGKYAQTKHSLQTKTLQAVLN